MDARGRLSDRRSPLVDVTVDAPVLSAPQPWGLAVVFGRPPEGDVADAVIALGPARWLAVHEDPPEGARSVEVAHEGASAVDVSHGMTRIRVSGLHARSVLSSGIALDLDPEVFGPGSSATTAYRDVAVVLHAASREAYDLYVMRSFAASLWEWLTDAAAGTG